MVLPYPLTHLEALTKQHLQFDHGSLASIPILLKQICIQPFCPMFGVVLLVQARVC